jgi:hypothetical protein
MQYLMVLLVMIGVIVLMIGAVLGISYGVGYFLYSRTRIPADPANTDPCAQCQADRDWYEALPIWKQNVVTAWWLANRYLCAAKGCT